MRVAFLAVCLVILAEAVAVLALVTFTLMKIQDARQAVGIGQPAPITRAASPLDALADAAKANLNVWDRHGPINILLMGLDIDDCTRAGGLTRRTDTLILVRVDPATERAAMMSIPRDLLVFVEGHGERKINTAHVVGMTKDNPDGGTELLKKTIEANLGLPVHRYIRVDIEGFKQIIDAVDGVDIEVGKNGLYDDAFPDGHCGTITINFKPGLQHMDSTHALQYARSRHSSSDFDRSRRQIQLLMAIRERGLRMNTLLDLHQLLPALPRTVTTDLSPAEIVALLPLAQKLDPATIARFPIDEHMVYDDSRLIDNGYQSVLILKQAEFNALRIRFLATGAHVPGLDDLTPTPSPRPPGPARAGKVKTAPKATSEVEATPEAGATP